MVFIEELREVTAKKKEETIQVEDRKREERDSTIKAFKEMLMREDLLLDYMNSLRTSASYGLYSSEELFLFEEFCTRNSSSITEDQVIKYKDLLKDEYIRALISNLIKASFKVDVKGDYMIISWAPEGANNE